MMETLDTKQLLGYTLETFAIQEFKEYHDTNSKRFSDFSRKAFLKSIGIPPSYFLEQPLETQEELLNNKLELSKVHSKYQGISILVVSKDNEILNVAKIKTADIELKFETISSIEDIENIVWFRSVIKDGYICGYFVCGSVCREGYNKAIFIDFPILFTKPTIIHEGFVELSNSNMEVEKDMIYYDKTETVNYEDYQHVALAMQAHIEKIDKDTLPIDKEDKVPILRESIDVVCQLVEEKVIPKALLLPVSSYIDDKREYGIILNTSNLVEYLISFENNVKTLKAINNLLSCKSTIKLCFGKSGTEKS